MLVSVGFIMLTLYVYYLLPELRETQDKVTILTIINLATFLFFLAILQTEHPSDQLGDHCVYISYLVFFFSLAYFAWLNCTLANVWKIIVWVAKNKLSWPWPSIKTMKNCRLRKWKISENKWYLLNHIYAWSVPTLAIICLSMRGGTHEIFSSLNCWFHRKFEFSTMLTTNIIQSILFRWPRSNAPHVFANLHHVDNERHILSMVESTFNEQRFLARHTEGTPL